MNELTKELWDKAARATAAYPSGQNNSWETQVNFMDKFTELIVKECVFISRTSTDGFSAGRRMEEHFGVKE